MEQCNDRFYWWVIPKSSASLEAAPKEDTFCDTAILTDLLPKKFNLAQITIVSYRYLNKLLQSTSLDLNQIWSVPLSILPGPINNEGLSSQTFERPFGHITFKKDLSNPESDITVSLSTSSLIPSCSDSSLCHPSSSEAKRENKSRTITNFSLFPKIDSMTNLFVARVPEELSSETPEIISWLNSARSIWTAGMASLKKLSLLGVNVTGTVDSLGEKELDHPLISKLFGNRWLKLTYKDSRQENIPGTFPSFSWYTLNDDGLNESLAKKTHFFWMSVSSYTTAVAKFPIIASQFHSSGLGATYDFFSTHFTSDHYQPFYSIADWRKYILKEHRL